MDDDDNDDGTPLAGRVHDLLLDCLYTEEENPNGEIPSDAIIAEGIVKRFVFHPGRVEANRSKIAALLAEMDPTFKEGWSFLNLCVTKDGVHWGEHPSCEALMCLGLAIGKVAYCAPREMWPMLPGAMPYLMIND